MRVAASLLLTLLVTSFAVADDPPSKNNPVADSTLALGIDLCRVLRTTDRNTVLSPYSITTALSMAKVGARGKTGTEIDNALHLPGDVPATAHKALREAVTSARGEKLRESASAGGPTYLLTSQNTVLLPNGLSGIRPKFLQSIKGSFAASIQWIDERGHALARNSLGDWVTKHLRGRVSHSSEGSEVVDWVLVNAIQFKSFWMERFEKDKTCPGTFHVRGDRPTTVPIMHRTGLYNLVEDKGTRILELPLRGHDTSMVIVLPSRRGGLDTLIKSLTAKRLRQWLDDLSYPAVSVAVALPRFKTSCRTDLAKPLQILGVTSAFDRQKADFSAASSGPPLVVSAVLHQANIAVDEAGIEAKAHTAVVTRRVGGPPAPQVKFIADRPFLFLIRHMKTGTVLFVGCIEDPTQKG